MDLIENIIHYFKHDGKEKASPLGTCSICWGYQQYDDKIRDLLNLNRNGWVNFIGIYNEGG